MHNTLGQSQSRDSLYPVEAKGELTVLNRLRSPRRVVLVLRFLMSKFILEGPLSQREQLTLTEAYLVASKYKDPGMVAKISELLEFTEYCLPLMDSDSAVDPMVVFMFGKLGPWFLGYHSKSGYYSVKKTLEEGKYLSKVIRKWKRLPPVAYIGRGYNDKGNRRVVTLDGSPSWQEVASSRSKKYDAAESASTSIRSLISSGKLGWAPVDQSAVRFWEKVLGKDCLKDILLDKLLDAYGRGDPLSPQTRFLGN